MKHLNKITNLTKQSRPNLNPKYMAIAVRHVCYRPNMMLTFDEAQHEITIQNIIALSRVMTAKQLDEFKRLSSQQAISGIQAQMEEQPDGTVTPVDPTDQGIGVLFDQLDERCH